MYVIAPMSRIFEGGADWREDKAWVRGLAEWLKKDNLNIVL